MEMCEIAITCMRSSSESSPINGSRVARPSSRFEAEISPTRSSEEGEQAMRVFIRVRT